MVECFSDKEEVDGSNPSGMTSLKKKIILPLGGIGRHDGLKNHYFF